ncbi:substrate-binding periplasmic protein [Oceanospirillum sediminis]|uniref:Transporter substrate-binding domain-containing protein n=1 Tax=Oceanospirillum sediminis TaxID=2760088 RepID=A0A839IW82_9GAMM|nr:transporter substrate-binding domain-containing protein [Oceanospirillum sediminis]MBB1489625.1 transporter substrate-binding domain-containing protein [Oceanospirillum sediminis]
MKISVAVLTGILSLIWPVSLLAEQDDGPVTMRFCYENQQYLPYVIQLGSQGAAISESAGMLTDMVKMATEKAGIKAQFIHYPWKRCIALLESGQVDGIYAAIWQKKREAWGRFPKQGSKPDETLRMWRAEYHIFTHRDSGLQWDGQQFSGVKTGLAAPLGYVADEKLGELNVKAQNNYLPEEGLRLVALQRLDGYVVESAIGEHLLRLSGIEGQIRVLKKVFLYADWYVPLSHQWVSLYPEKARLFWQHLARIREERGKTLYEKYSHIQ